MIVHNLTDVETPKLKQFGLENASFSIAGELVAPGTSKEVPDEDHALRHLDHLIEIGALCLGDPPASYGKGKKVEKMANPEPKPALVRLESDPPVEETKVESPSSKRKFSKE